MNKLYVLFALSIAIATPALAQKNIDKLIYLADVNYFEAKNFEEAEKLYREVDELTEVNHPGDAYAKEKIARCLYFKHMNARTAQDFDAIAATASTYIDHVEANREHLERELIDQKYYMLQHMIVLHNQREESDAARKCQEQLYIAWFRKDLPDNMKESYQIEAFEVDGRSVLVYESFDQVRNFDGQDAFDKHVFYVFDGEVTNDNRNLSYTFQTERLVKEGETAMNDFVLTRTKGEGIFKDSQAYWGHTFKSPCDYRLVKEAVTAELNKIALQTKVGVAQAE